MNNQSEVVEKLAQEIYMRTHIKDLDDAREIARLSALRLLDSAAPPVEVEQSDDSYWMHNCTAKGALIRLPLGECCDRCGAAPEGGQEAVATVQYADPDLSGLIEMRAEWRDERTLLPEGALLYAAPQPAGLIPVSEMEALRKIAAKLRGDVLPSDFELCGWADELDRIAAHQSTQPSVSPSPQSAQAGLPVTQEPKYTIVGDHIVNRASGEAIPHDEPIFILRARDMLAADGIADYGKRCAALPDHHAAVDIRVADFTLFRLRHPKRMKMPDTATPSAQQDTKP